MRYLWRVFVDTTHSFVLNIFVADAIHREVCIRHDWCDNLGFPSVKARYLLVFMPINSSQTPNQRMPPSQFFFIDPQKPTRNTFSITPWSLTGRKRYLSESPSTTCIQLKGEASNQSELFFQSLCKLFCILLCLESSLRNVLYCLNCVCIVQIALVQIALYIQPMKT
jgi:hypothetical protein